MQDSSTWRSGAARLNLSRQADVDKPVGIGLDFGTSNSAAAIFDGKSVQVVQLERARNVMPSACYITREFSIETGEDAIATYIEQNRGRRVELSAEVLGEARLSTGQIDEKSRLPTTADTNTIYGREVHDASMPGRLFFGIKRLLGNADTQRIAVFERPFRLVALVTPIVKRMYSAAVTTAEQQPAVDKPCSHACLGHPVDFEGDAGERNSVALQRLCEAAQHAGVQRQLLCPEPIGAAISYLQKSPIDRPFRALTVDFGGGTLDLCVVRSDGTQLSVEAVHGIGLGGNRIDQAVFRTLIFPLLGKGERWVRTVEGHEIDTEFPFWRYEERLLNWQVSYSLNQNEFLTPVVDQLAATGERRTKFLRLYELITTNCAFEVIQAIRTAKEALSTQTQAVIDVPEIDLQVTLERAQFESIISELLTEFEDAVDKTLSNAELQASDIDLVIRTGGSALIPAFANALTERFPGKVTEHDPFTGVAAGLAIADYYGIGAEP